MRKGRSTAARTQKKPADAGDTHLDRQVTSTTTTMALSDDTGHFKANFARVHNVKIEAKNKPLRFKAQRS
jgi:hypothetical protein